MARWERRPLSSGEIYILSQYKSSNKTLKDVPFTSRWVRIGKSKIRDRSPSDGQAQSNGRKPLPILIAGDAPRPTCSGTIARNNDRNVPGGEKAAAKRTAPQKFGDVRRSR
jgi:hypothetical protein